MNEEELSPQSKPIRGGLLLDSPPDTDHLEIQRRPI